MLFISFFFFCNDMFQMGTNNGPLALSSSGHSNFSPNTGPCNTFTRAGPPASRSAFSLLRTNTRHGGEGRSESGRRRRQLCSVAAFVGAEKRLPERRERERDGAGERVGPGGGEHAVVRGQRAGRPPRVEQPRLLDRRRNPRLLPLGQARAPAPEGAGGDGYHPPPLLFQHYLRF